jgi:uncharacterized damage-inducible protein DinB
VSIREGVVDVSEVVEAWRTNGRINRMLIDAVPDAGWTATLSARGGRDVGRQFAHLHDVRLYHLEKRARDLAEGLEKFSSKDVPARTPSREEVIGALEASGDRIATFLSELATGAPTRKGFRKGLATTLAYFVAHESHHRGSIVLTLKQAGHPVPKDVRYGIWDWDRR